MRRIILLAGRTGSKIEVRHLTAAPTGQILTITASGANDLILTRLCYQPHATQSHMLPIHPPRQTRTHFHPVCTSLSHAFIFSRCSLSLRRSIPFSTESAQRELLGETKPREEFNAFFIHFGLAPRGVGLDSPPTRPTRPFWSPSCV